MTRCITKAEKRWHTLLSASAILLASTALSSVSYASTSAASSCASVLNASDFTYKGAIAVYGGVIDQSPEGLAYRNSTNTWFTIAHAGHQPYNLIELSLPFPDPAHPQRATIVKDWGPLDIDGALDLKNPKNGAQMSLVGMKGLYWDDKENRLWVTIGSFYNAPHLDQPVLAYVTLDSGKPVIHGPWKVSVTSDLAKGMIIEAPADLQAITHQRFLMFGLSGSTMQDQSWGVGLVSVAEPGATNAVGSALASEKLIHWPMLSTKVGVLPQGAKFLYHSNMPPLPVATTMIDGNENVGHIVRGTAQRGTATTITLSSATDYSPSTASASASEYHTLAGNWYVTNLGTGEQLAITGWDNKTKIATVAGGWKKSIPVSGSKYELYLASYEPNIVVPVHVYTSEYNNMAHASWIELPNQKCGLVYFGNVAEGYRWYGNGYAHADATPNGKKYDNDFVSLLHPGQPVVSDAPYGRGDQAEAHGLGWYVVDPNAVLNVAKKVTAGTATAQDLQISWTNGGDAKTLGGNVLYGSSGRIHFGESYWDAKDGLLYVLAPGGGPNGTGLIEVWQVQ